MNKVFDYNGTFVSASKPTKILKRVKKTFLVDSADRDTVKYYTNGDFVVYLPRVYENVISLRLMAAEFPLIISSVAQGILSFSFNAGTNIVTVVLTSVVGVVPGNNVTISDATSPGNNGTFTILTVNAAPTNSITYTNPNGVTEAGSASNVNLGAHMHNYSDSQNYVKDKGVNFLEKYFLIDIEGLNKSDECSVQADRSGYPDSYFAKIPTVINGSNIEYNDHSHQDNIAEYKPAISKLDRLHIRTRMHSQQGNKGFIYWTTDNDYAKPSNVRGSEFSLSFEIEYLDNVFDDFSQFETRIN